MPEILDFEYEDKQGSVMDILVDFSYFFPHYKKAFPLSELAMAMKSWAF